jgi:hypothetical protein
MEMLWNIFANNFDQLQLLDIVRQKMQPILLM